MGRAILAFSQNLFGYLANSMQTVDCEHQDGCVGGGGGGWGRGVSFSRGQFSFGSVFQALVFKGAVGGEWEYIFLIPPVAIYAW